MKELSVWVDEFYGGIIGHGMFVRSLCPEKTPTEPLGKLIRWLQPGTSYFDRGDLPLGYCKVSRPEARFHLYSLGEAAWGAFHDSHTLNELDFQPKLAGIVVVIERESVMMSLERKSKKGINSISSLGAMHFSWFEKQRLPYVIAATGYQGAKAELEFLRTALALTSDIPMIPGPSLWQGAPLLFDTEHANQVLFALYKEIKHGI
ncbi:MAG TPA: hypothetical protein PLD25_01875 [Chloroflexota bacterium]|nr:hypothetical protein [Chloroflexota bacterium]HUM71554.1 hypothetical protein [Chloroflexota bacterium]